jgi:hypothetical protein
MQARRLDTHTQSICLESCCQTNFGLDVKNGEGHHHAETTCSHTHIEAHPPINEQAFHKKKIGTVHSSKTILYYIQPNYMIIYDSSQNIDTNSLLE